MHAFHLANLAVSFSHQAITLHKIGTLPSRQSSNSYWLASRFRHEEWSGQLARHRLEIQRPGVSHRAARWNQILPVIQEVLLAEPLARFIAYFAEIQQSRVGSHPAESSDEPASDFASLAATTCNAHIEARNRCLNLIVFGQGLAAEQAERLNKLRHEMEYLSDQLLATLPQRHALDFYAFDLPNVEETHSAIFGSGKPDAHLRIQLVALRLYLEKVWQNLDPRTGCGRLNQRVAKVMLKMFSTDLFDSFGLPKSFDRIRQYAVSELHESAPRQNSLFAVNSSDAAKNRLPSESHSSTKRF
ncbi:MAG TPA: hypothetical protein DDW52_29040 [Planctomycetaceae bacterium]|nr:hypothetical protein [Planctomycetaceae bacterium]